MKARNRAKRLAKQERDALFFQAAKLEEEGKFSSAFRLYLRGAKAGDLSCQLNVGDLYDDGKGIRRNCNAALYWWKRAYRRGHAAAASNIGIVLRNKGQFERALAWFKRSVRLGDAEAHLEIGKYYLHTELDYVKAVRHFELVLQSESVSEAGREEAARLLKQATAAPPASRS